MLESLEKHVAHGVTACLAAAVACAWHIYQNNTTGWRVLLVYIICAGMGMIAAMLADAGGWSTEAQGAVTAIVGAVGVNAMKILNDITGSREAFLAFLRAWRGQK